MPKEFGTNHARFFESGNSWPKFWTVQNTWAEFPIDLRIARTHYGLCESVKTITHWVRFSHESKYLSIRVNSWDSGPVWNIPLFHTGHESPELPRIDFLLIRGDSWGFIKKISPIVMVYESVPIQIGFRHEYSGESAQFGWNRTRIHYE